ncbi:ABC transporter substrate-binding protein [Guptibacillus hwajinpoensis]|uniref:Iron complex transport system substrate-binding protein n=1 Tax=Guptibacillus hwajinpoensis TaxID=208199 RepID=A0ABU0K0G9_9BACL|nr:iron-siderophore ABC transporter substrate-binding protein [Alkalihalobacillus hemicentroti]MDQ0482185.1 iron complex transport system substrate-binding protein [Alkalihalobacillus hemicentroti]
MFKKGWLILTLAMVMILAACGTSENNASEGNSEEPKEEQTARTVSHAMGETEVPENPEKVVILTNEGTEALLAMDVTPVGAVQSWLGDPWYDHISDQMEGVEVVGTESEVNLEAVAALKPDLIIGNKLRQEDIYDQLSAIAPTVYSETLKGDWQENFTFYAEALNMEDKGDEVMSSYNDRIDSMSEELGEQLDKEVSVVRFLAGQTRIYYKDSFSGVVLEQLGFNRPESQQKQEFAEEVTKERIPEMDGDVLFYFTYDPGDGDANSTAEEWTNDPLWNNLEVVKEDNVHEVSDAIWNTSGGVISANKMLDDIDGVFLSE